MKSISIILTLVIILASSVFSWWWWGPPRKERILFDRREDVATQAKELPETYTSREFSYPDRYPGYNLEVLEEKKIEFLINELKIYQSDAEEVSEHYKETLQASNDAMRSRPASAMTEISNITADYEVWLQERLGEEDFKRFVKFISDTMMKHQKRYAKFRENQKDTSK